MICIQNSLFPCFVQYFHFSSMDKDYRGICIWEIVEKYTWVSKSNIQFHIFSLLGESFDRFLRKRKKQEWLIFQRWQMSLSYFQLESIYQSVKCKLLPIGWWGHWERHRKSSINENTQITNTITNANTNSHSNKYCSRCITSSAVLASCKCKLEREEFWQRWINTLLHKEPIQIVVDKYTCRQDLS